MPEEKYSFAPSTGEFHGARTFAQEVKHVAFANHVFFGAIVGEKAEAGPGREGPESIRTKAEILSYLRESFALAHRAIGTITSANVVTVMDNVPVPRFKTPLAMTTHACAHAYDHYGQLVEYLRMNGIVPPASQSQPSPTARETAQDSLGRHPLILQEGDGEHLLRRYGEQTLATAPGSIPEFIIKIDKQNGGAEDFVAVTESLKPGAIIPFHMHHNAEEILILEEGGATVTVGDKRALAGPRSIVFIPRETWISVRNTANHPIHLYALFSRPGFEDYLRARSVRPGEPMTPLTSEERHKAEEQGHAMFWDTSKDAYPPGVPHP